ncbi:DUF86 domain-containing protein [Alteribacillus sp. HJP-4]|uniref:DUF86 domain-containing protein n=1 Tax=Alteribacillus sp. HJP-4 TaxID=2775394 RepID=UPI0035CCDEDA
MYFVDRKKIEAKLHYMEQINSIYSQLLETKGDLADLALERAAQGWIEAIIDTGNEMIDGFIMRDPGSYTDIIDILEDEKVLPNTEAEQLKNVVNRRKELVQEYTSIDHTALLATLNNNLDAIRAFPARIRYYLEQELGPVSAFLPEDKK